MPRMPLICENACNDQQKFGERFTITPPYAMGFIGI